MWKNQVLPGTMAALALRFGRVSADAVYEPDPYVLEVASDLLVWGILIFFGSLILWAIQLFARGRMLQRRAGRGWRILIPFYGRYLEYKNYWHEGYFWVNRAILLVLIAVGIFIYNSQRMFINGMLVLISMALWIIIFINRIQLRLHTMPLFGFSQLWGLLELILAGFPADCMCAFTNRKPLDILPDEQEDTVEQHA